RRTLQGPPLQRLLAYWREQLAEAPPLELPTDHPRPAIQSWQGASQQLTLSPALSRALTRLSQQQGVTLFMTLLAAWQVLLARSPAREQLLSALPGLFRPAEHARARTPFGRGDPADTAPAAADRQV